MIIVCSGEADLPILVNFSAIMLVAASTMTKISVKVFFIIALIYVSAAKVQQKMHIHKYFEDYF